MREISQKLHSEKALIKSGAISSMAPRFGANSASTREVTIGGALREKRTWPAFEAFFICVFLLSLFLTGCSSGIQGQLPSSPTAPGSGQVLQATGEATVPPTADGMGASASNGGSGGGISGTGISDAISIPGADANGGLGRPALASLIEQEAVIERVKLVTGWLKFVRQEHSMRAVQAGWERVKAGQVLSPLNNAGVADRPDISTSELMLWRQILASSQAANLETLAIVLTAAVTPDDVMQADNLLVVSENPSGY
jgi:hypothetical protein